MRVATFGACTLLALTAAGCTLPSYDKVSKGEYSCGSLSLPGTQSAECLECVRTHCCDLAKTCVASDTCSPGFSTDITPFASLPSEFDTTLGCMQNNCDSACNVSFACEGKDYIPFADPDTDGSYTFPLHLSDFSSFKPAPEIAGEACSGYTLACKVTPDTPVQSDATGLLNVPVDEEAKQSVALADPNYEPEGTSMSAYPPHIISWSVPMYKAAWQDLPDVALRDLVFRSSDVKNLVEMAAGKKFDRADSHIVFYMHNCLPLRFLGRPSPHGGVSGASITLTPNIGRDVADPIVYRSDMGYAGLDTTESLAPGSGGAAIVSSGIWTATADLTHTSAASPTMQTQVFVPPGGIGVVHLFPRTSTP